MNPKEVLAWPAWLFMRARAWLSSANQADADRAENEAAERAAGIRK